MSKGTTVVDAIVFGTNIRLKAIMLCIDKGYRNQHSAPDITAWAIEYGSEVIADTCPSFHDSFTMPQYRWGMEG